MKIIGVSLKRNRWVVLWVVLWLTRCAMAQYVELSAQIEVNVWGKQPEPFSFSFLQDTIAELRPTTVHCVVNSNTWEIDDDFGRKDGRTTHWFTGTNIVEYELVNGVPTYTRVSDSNDGNPGQGRNQQDQLNVVARIAWLAFCSGPCLKREGREISPPSDLWKDLLTIQRFSDETVTFDDPLGLPKTVTLTTGKGQPIFQYRTIASTNVSGWEFPLEFKVAQYRPVHRVPSVPTGTKGWELEFTATGKVTAVKPASNPQLPRVTIGTNGSRQLTFTATERELWDEVVGTAGKTDTGGYSASFGDVCTVGITVDRPYKILARRQRGWPFVLEYKLNAPDGESTLSVSLDTSDFRSSDDEVFKSPGFSGIERRKIRVGSEEVVFREWSDSRVHNSDAFTRLDVVDSHSQVPIVIGITAHAKDRRKALEDAVQSMRLEPAENGTP